MQLKSWGLSISVYILYIDATLSQLATTSITSHRIIHNSPLPYSYMKAEVIEDEEKNEQESSDIVENEENPDESNTKRNFRDNERHEPYLRRNENNKSNRKVDEIAVVNVPLNALPRNTVQSDEQDSSNDIDDADYDDIRQGGGYFLKYASEEAQRNPPPPPPPNRINDERESFKPYPEIKYYPYNSDSSQRPYSYDDSSRPPPYRSNSVQGAPYKARNPKPPNSSSRFPYRTRNLARPPYKSGYSRPPGNSKPQGASRIPYSTNNAYNGNTKYSSYDPYKNGYRGEYNDESSEEPIKPSYGSDEKGYSKPYHGSDEEGYSRPKYGSGEKVEPYRSSYEDDGVSYYEVTEKNTEKPPTTKRPKGRIIGVPPPCLRATMPKPPQPPPKNYGPIHRAAVAAVAASRRPLYRIRAPMYVVRRPLILRPPPRVLHVHHYHRPPPKHHSLQLHITKVEDDDEKRRRYRRLVPYRVHKSHSSTKHTSHISTYRHAPRPPPPTTMSPLELAALAYPI